MFGYGYGFGRGFGYGFGRRFGWGNPTPYCRAYPWLPRGWWKWGYAPYDFEEDYYGIPRYPYYGYGRYFASDELTVMRDTLKGISDVLTEIERRLAEMEKK